MLPAAATTTIVAFTRNTCIAAVQICSPPLLVPLPLQLSQVLPVCCNCCLQLTQLLLHLLLLLLQTALFPLQRCECFVGAATELRLALLQLLQRFSRHLYKTRACGQQQTRVMRGRGMAVIAW